MNYNEYMANIKAYRNGTLMQAAPTDALSDWHEKYFDTAVSALSKKMIADHVEHSEDADKFGKDFVSLVAILEEDGVSKQDIGKELEAVSKAAQSQADAAIKKLDSVQHSTDTFEGYQAAIKAYKETHLEHAEWKKHKYIRIENGRYIYPEDLKKNNNTSRNNQVPLNKQISNKIGSTLSNLTPKKTTTAPTSPARTDQISGEKYVENKLKDIATGIKNIGSAVKEYRSEAEAKKAAAEAMKAGRAATQQYKESGQYERDVADEKAKIETMARQDEAKKITSLTPDEARKRAAELTKQNTPEESAFDKKYKIKVSDNSRVQKAYDEMLKIVPDSNKDWNGEWKKADAIAKEIGLNKDELREFEKVLAHKRSQQAAEAGKEYAMPKGESLTKQMDFDAEEKRINDVLTNQDKNGSSVKTETANKSEAPKQEDSNTEKQSEAEKNLKEMARKYAHYADLTKNIKYPSASIEWSNLVKAAKEYAEETGEDYRKVLERTLEESKKVQHSDPRAAFYAAIDEYKVNHLEHGEWKKHKYIRIENGRYIYPEDAKKGSIGAKVPASAKNPVNGDLKSGNYVKFENGKAVYSNTARPGYQLTTKAAAGMKKFAEATSQLSPQEQYKKAQAEKNKVTPPTPEAPKAETPSNEDRVKAMMDAHHEELKKAVYDNYKKNAQEIIKGNGKYFSDLVTNPSKAEEYNTKRNEYVQACSNDMLSNYLFAKGTGLSNEEAKEYVVSILDDLNNSYKEGLRSKGYEADSEKSPFSVVFQETDHGTDKASVASLSISFDGRVKKIQHSLFSRDDFYAAVADYKNQRVPL